MVTKKKEHLLPAGTSCTGTCEVLPRSHDGVGVTLHLLPPGDHIGSFQDDVDDDDDDDVDDVDDDDDDDVDDDNHHDQVSSLSSCPPPKLVDAALVFLPEEDGEVRPIIFFIARLVTV